MYRTCFVELFFEGSCIKEVTAATYTFNHIVESTWGRCSCQPRGQLPSMVVTITEEAPSFTSPGSSDRAHWLSEPGHEALLSGPLSAGCMLRLVDKDPDRGVSRVQGQYRNSSGSVGEKRITCQLGKVKVKNDGCQPVGTRGGEGSAG